ncbi:putative membrane protein, partial [Yersinia pestis PY-56]
MKGILYNVLFSTIPFIVIALFSMCYLEFFPNHFG